MGTLSHLRVLDLARVFAGPWAGQMLADFGADVIKVERPGRGDDVRHQGYRVKNAAGEDTRETSSFIAMNRGKRSVTIALDEPEGQRLVRELAARSDVLIENYKVGDLARYGLDYASLAAVNPKLVYCSITGYGQTGPMAEQPGYDPLFQGMSGLMSITGQPEGVAGAGPVKVGYSTSDINAGLYAVIAILAAVNHRDQISGVGQHIDIALLDAQIASLAHIASNYLVSGRLPQRTGTASEITCPYQAFECSDGELMVAVGNDAQFVAFCAVLSLPAVPTDPRFATNPERARHRTVLVPLIAERMKAASVAHWSARFGTVGVPCGPINTLAQTFAEPQVIEREVLRSMPHPSAGTIPIIANPVRFSATPVEYRRPPPLLSEHTREVLREVLAMGDAEIDQLATKKVI